MNQTVTLPFEGGHLALRPDERGWCDVGIVTARGRRHFGAEAIGAIARRILSKLLDCNAIDEFQEVQAINLLNVSEPHGSVYLEAASKPSRRLSFRDRDGNLIHTTFVSAEQLGSWESTLSDFRNDYMRLSDA